MCTCNEATSATFNGAVSLKNKTFTELTLNGAAELSNITASELIARGALNAEKSIFEKATISGSANLENCTCNQELVIHGSCNIEDSLLKKTVIYGSVNMENSKNVDIINVFGNANLDQSTIQDFESNGSKIDFTNCDVLGSIQIKKPKQGWFGSFFTNKKQQVTLTDTIVHGDIIFEEDGGKIILRGKSKIHGKIIGCVTN